MLACSCGSLGTISSTKIFGAIFRDEAKVYLPWDIIIHLVLSDFPSLRLERPKNQLLIILINKLMNNGANPKS